MKDLEKRPSSSKKFIAFLISIIGWMIILVLMIFKGTSSLSIMATVIVSGFISVGYILGQAALDKYVRMATILKSESELDSIAKHADQQSSPD